MTRRRKLMDHMHQLTEIRDVMDAMKNLALLETHKLGNLLHNQQALAEDLDRVAGDFLDFYPHTPQQTQTDCWILFGSERGFCGDFNDALLNELDARLAASADRRQLLVSLGDKLQTKLQDERHVAAFIVGADVAEEINSVLNTLIEHLNALQSEQGSMNMFALFHDATSDKVASRPLMPPFEAARNESPQRAYPPCLNIEPTAFFPELLDRYLFVALQEIAYTSLMAENQKRIQHMTGAVHRLDETTARLMRQYHMQRQEDITEEIEVILLNAVREY